jgi:TPR repeat protein
MRLEGLCVLTATSIGACHGQAGQSDGAQGAPSASAITLGIAVGACDDIARCNDECDAGRADRCRRLAASYAFGEGVDKDEALATALYERACGMGDAAACVFGGQMREYAHGVPKDDTAAVALYDHACNLRWAAGCYNLAFMYERGRGVAENRTKAADLYGVACAAGAKTACVKLGALGQRPVVSTDAGT